MQMPSLPPGVVVFERGWLSANNILFVDDASTALVDTGYCTHAAQTVRLVEQVLGTRALDRLVNTHLHSDHCGGNAALQARFPGVETLIPPGLADAVRSWDPVALTYLPTGQSCPPFRIDGVLEHGTQVELGSTHWEVHGAPGHDPHSNVLFEPATRTLISADALWERGFGVVFPELEGDSGFAEVAATLDVIERLAPSVVIPGHGAVFTDVAAALSVARRRLDEFVRDPVSHARHAAKVLIKFKLLDWQSITIAELAAWTRSTPYLRDVHASRFADRPIEDWLNDLVDSLVRSGAATRAGDVIGNA